METKPGNRKGLGLSQIEMIANMEHGYYIFIFEELSPLKRTIVLKNEDGDEVDSVKSS